jgi:hypothetical protein
MSKPKSYVVAMLREGKFFSIKPLDTGRRYSREDAMKKAAQLQETCPVELKRLDYDRFVAYNPINE